MKIKGLPVIDVDESEEITVAVRADDLLEGDTGELGVPTVKKLVETLDSYIPEPKRDVDLPFLMSIEDVFSIAGRGTVVTGRIDRGNFGDLAAADHQMTVLSVDLIIARDFRTLGNDARGPVRTIASERNVGSGCGHVVDGHSLLLRDGRQPAQASSAPFRSGINVSNATMSRT